MARPGSEDKSRRQQTTDGERRHAHRRAVPLPTPKANSIAPTTAGQDQNDAAALRHAGVLLLLVGRRGALREAPPVVVAVGVDAFTQADGLTSFPATP